MQRSGSAAKPARPHSRTGRTYILYAVLDFIVDNYKPVLETIHGEVEAIEDRVLSAELAQTEVERLYMLRRDLLRLRNAVVPLVEVCRKLEHTEVIAIDPAMRPLFRDVIPTRVKADSFRGFQTGASQALWGEQEVRHAARDCTSSGL